jgi:hypothetical protein
MSKGQIKAQQSYAVQVSDTKMLSLGIMLVKNYFSSPTISAGITHASNSAGVT